MRVISALLIAIVYSIPNADAQVIPNVKGEPIYGIINLEAGFLPDPWISDLQAGGNIDLFVIDFDGYVSLRPDYNLNYVAGDSHSLTITVESDSDTVLLINAPDGQWYFNDDFTDLDPLIYFSSPLSGVYNIWVGTFDNIDFAPAKLIITEL